MNHTQQHTDSGKLSDPHGWDQTYKLVSILLSQRISPPWQQLINGLINLKLILPIKTSMRSTIKTCIEFTITQFEQA